MFGGWLPGRIESYNATTRRADVQILVLDVDRDESDERAPKRFAPIVNAPVLLPGSGGARLKFPINKGDKCVVLLASRDVDKFLHLGTEVEPDSERHHHLSDALIIPGLEISAVDAPININVTATQVELAGADEQVMTAKDMRTNLYNVLTSPTVLAGIAAAPVDGGTSLTTALLAKLVTVGTRTNFGTSKVKAGV